LNLLEVSEVEAASLAEQSATVDTDALTRIMEVLTDADAQLREASSKKTLIEVALFKAIEARNAVSLDSVLKQLQQLRGDNSASAGAAPVAANAGPRQPPYSACTWIWEETTLQNLLQVVQVVVGEDAQFGATQAGGVHDAGVNQLINDDRVILAKQGADGADGGRVAAGKAQRRLSSLEGGKNLLQIMVRRQ